MGQTLIRCHMAFTKMLLPVCFKKQYGYTALMRAAANGHLEMTQLLLRRGARIDHQTEVMWCDAVSFHGGLFVSDSVSGFMLGVAGVLVVAG